MAMKPIKLTKRPCKMYKQKNKEMALILAFARMRAISLCIYPMLATNGVGKSLRL